jgi:2-C-methyl-D-erythritol 4-phosphate cytidylyltransferase
MRYWLVMPAAGQGQRFGGDIPKQYATLAGSTVIEWALAPFLDDERCAGIVVAIAPHDPHWPAVRARLDAAKVASAAGGAARSESVRSALGALAGRAGAMDWVLVHDAARPCLERRDLDVLLRELATHPLGGLLATPLTDTLKRGAPQTDGHALSAQTLERAGLWRALTPQMFRYGALCAALDAAHAARRFPSDEAQALEWHGAQPALIAGSARNLKITTAAELALAAALLEGRA